MNKIWSELEKNYIKEQANNYTDKELAKKMTELFGRIITRDAVRKKRQELKIRKKNGRGICEVVEKVKPEKNT